MAVCLLMGLLFFSSPLFSQEAASTIPDALRKPERGEAPRYPRDLVIGELGQGEAPEAAYRYAGDVVTALMAGSKTASAEAESLSVIQDSLFEAVTEIEPRTYHLGGGKVEPDGSVSFLVRFLGVEESIAGELYIRREEAGEAEEDEAPPPRWVLDDIVLEEKRPLNEIGDSYRYDFSPYERFY